MASPITLPPFLQNHLEAIAQKEGLIDFSIEYAAGSKHGDGFMAAVLGVSLKGSHKNESGNIVPKTISLICKLLPDNKARQELFSGHIVFEREVHFYTNILPLFEQVQKRHALSPETGFFGYPHCYAAVANADTNEYVIIMRDLRAEGYTLWDKMEPITFEKVFPLMEQLGRMHGLSFVIRDQQPDAFKHIRALTDIMGTFCNTPTMKIMMESNYDKTIEMLDNTEHIKVVGQVKQTWQDMMAECVNGDLAEPFAVMTHGDCWNNNFMFSDTKICILDWQICRFASPVLDLVYFLLTSTNKELRDQHYDQLIGIYHENMTNIINRCGAKLERPFRLVDLHDQLRKFGKFGVLMAPLLLQVIVSDPNNISNLDDMAEMIQKDANNSKNAFAKFDAVSTANFQKRLGDAIDDAKRLGWI